jgi:hypothetical protein
MAYLTVPTRADVPAYTQRTALDGVTYVLTFRWNERASYWTLSIADQDAAPIASGLALLTGSMLLRRCVDARRPPGELVVVDTTGEGGDAGLSDLGTRFALVYADAETMAELRGDA